MITAAGYADIFSPKHRILPYLLSYSKVLGKLDQILLTGVWADSLAGTIKMELPRSQVGSLQEGDAK
jgi:hypothetical protein